MLKLCYHKAVRSRESVVAAAIALGLLLLQAEREAEELTGSCGDTDPELTTCVLSTANSEALSAR